MAKTKARPRYAYMSRRGLGTLHGLIVESWRLLGRYDTMSPAAFREAAKLASIDLNHALKIIEKKQGPLA